MIQKGFITALSNTSVVLTVNGFHIYKSSQRRITYLGNFLKVLVCEVLPENYIKKKNKHQTILVQTNCN